MSTFYSPFSHPFAKPLSRAKNVPLVLLGESFAYNPASDPDALQVFSTFAYADSPLDSLPVLSSSVGTAAVPRGQRCALFDGSNDYAENAGLGSAIGSLTAFTFCVNLLETATNNNKGVINFGSFANDAGILRVLMNIGNVQVSIDNGATNLTTPRPTVGTATHLAITWDGTTLSIYFNGVLQTSAARTATLTLTGLKFILGGYFSSGFVVAGKMWDARLYSVAKTASELESIANQHLTQSTIDRTGALAIWPLQEESGTTHYDIVGNNDLTATNITQATYHATDAGVKYSFSNELGYTQSGNIIIPASLANPTQDAAGGALQFSGPIALSGVMEVPCWTGNGTNANVNCGAAYVPASVNFTLGFWYRPTGTLSDKGPLTQGNNTSAASRFGLYHVAEDSLTLLVDHISGVGSGSVTRPITKDVWSYVEIVRSGTTYTLTIAGSSASITNSGIINQGNLILGLYAGFAAGSIAGLSITASGVTRYPLFDQCGPGSSNTNRDFYIMGSDGSATLVSGGIVNGTISAIYANRCPFVRDWCIENGGGIAANGAFVPGRIGSSLDAAGNAKTLPAGEHRNPFSRFDPNNWSAPSLVTIGSTASDAYAPSGMAGVQAESVADTRFASQKRYAAFRVAQTGADKTNAEGWAAG